MALDLAALEPGARRRSSRTCPTGSPRRRSCARSRSCRASTRWIAMVQREVGERLAAAPGTSAYGIPSVLAQLACEVRVLRPVSRTVFHPVPNVDSVLVRLDRTGPAAGAAGCARSCRRRSRTGARRLRARWRSRSRPSARAARTRTGVGCAIARVRRWPSSASPPTCAPSVSLHPSSAPLREAHGVSCPQRRTRAGEDQPRPLRSGPARADGRHELVDGHAAGRPVRPGPPRPGPARRGARRGPLPRGRRRQPRAGRARGVPRADRLGRRAGADRDRQADSGRGRNGRRIGRRGRGPAARRACRGPP